MRTRPLPATCLATALAAAFALPAQACGEGIFSLGDALRYDGYLAPRPASVLVYEPDADATEDRIAVYRGLARAGHRVTVVTDAGQLGDALAKQPFDVVVVDDEYAGALAATAVASTRQLRVVPGAPARTASDGNRRYVRGSASLGTWLGAINRLLKN